MAANWQDCRKLALIAHKHKITEAALLEMQEAVQGTANKSVRETFDRLVAEFRATRPVGDEDEAEAEQLTSNEMGRTVSIKEGRYAGKTGIMVDTGLLNGEVRYYLIEDHDDEELFVVFNGQWDYIKVGEGF